MPTIPPKKLERILAATDFSSTANAGVDWAIELALAHDARIDLVHALLVPSRATDFVPSPPDFTEALQEAASGRLNEITIKVREMGVEVSAELKLGVPSQVIIEAATQQDADLVVIGTRGLSGLRHLLLGSTAERVVQHAHCPVLTVHPGDADKHRPLDTILVPTDFSKDAETAYFAALNLLGRQSSTKVVLLHVYHLPYEYTAYGTIPTSLDYFRDVEGAAEERLITLAEEIRKQGFQVETLAREGFPPEVILGEAQTAGADLIAMGTHGRTGLAHLVLGSTAERVVQRADCPVLTVRGDEIETPDL
jgi:nucleotide-binding universal stress UspA family protein